MIPQKVEEKDFLLTFTIFFLREFKHKKKTSIAGLITRIIGLTNLDHLNFGGHHINAMKRAVPQDLLVFILNLNILSDFDHKKEMNSI
jgi:hypothetical protein